MKLADMEPVTRSWIPCLYLIERGVASFSTTTPRTSRRETRAWLVTRPAGRFDFTFTPTHGSWLNLIECFFSKFARSVLRHIRVASKYELKERRLVSTTSIAAHSSTYGPKQARVRAFQY
jgi:hypothetical protein